MFLLSQIHHVEVYGKVIQLTKIRLLINKHDINVPKCEIKDFSFCYFFLEAPFVVT